MFQTMCNKGALKETLNKSHSETETLLFQPGNTVFHFTAYKRICQPAYINAGWVSLADT